MQRGFVALALAAASLATGSSARADSARPARVTLITPRCATPSFDVGDFARLLRIELLADGVREVERRETVGADALAVLSLEGGCDEGLELTIAIDDLATRKTVRRVISLADVARPARARAVALASAELLRASWAELLLPDAPAPAAVVPPSVREAAAARLARAPARVDSAARPGDVVPALLISAALDVRFFPTGKTTLVGGHAGVGLALPRSLRLGLEAGSWFGVHAAALGKVDYALTTGAASIGADLALGRSAFLALGPKLELGFAHVAGAPADTTTAVHSGSAFAAIGSIVASGRARIAGRLWLEADAALGATFHGLTSLVDDRDTGGLVGPVGSASLGAAIGW